ncbi:MAG: DUF1361 domain-containing protein [Bacteroidetes bacterium]|nr:DUF1361 domain-containing protein [Bacteroidota bacterium]
MKKIFFLRTEMDRLLTSSMLFSCMLVVVRIAHTGRLTFIFMIWNLFLAYVPYALSTWLVSRYTQPGTRSRGAQLLLVLLSLTWLLFIPNAFYILTDLYHLTDGYRHNQVPQWFDLVLILSFAWNGLLLGVLSVRQMERLFLRQASFLKGWLFIYPIMALNALGVYLGRYPRYNSWDIISDPLELIKDILMMIVHPFRNQYAWGMILCFSILLTLIYRMLRGGSKALA